MTKIKNRSSLVKTPKTARKKKSGIKKKSPLSKAIVKNLRKTVLFENKSPSKSWVDVVEGEPINISRNTKSSKPVRYSVQNQENIDANGTINLCEDDSINKSITTPENPTGSPQSESPSTSKSEIVIDITESSVIDGDLTHTTLEELEIIEIKNKTADSILIDLSADDSTKCINQDLDDIVILDAKCSPRKDDIEIIGQKIIPKKKYSAYLKSPKNKSPRNSEKQTKSSPAPSSPSLNLNTENSTLDFIPLESNKNIRNNVNNYQFNNPNNPSYDNPGRKVKNKKFNRKMKMIKRLSTNSLSPKSKLQAIGSNIYSDKPLLLPSSGLRPIIIDGSNVAFHHSNNRHFSCKGLEICINYFKQKGHKVTAFVPQIRVKADHCDNPKLLQKLVEQGDVILTPSRIIDGRPVVSYDDRYIVQTAALKGGIIVTRDNYNDLLAENPAWRETIKYRLLQFTWVDDVLMFPKDPLGCRGPSLERFLRF